MLTNYEKYLVLAGLHIGVTENAKEDYVADFMDDLWGRLSSYQQGCAREATKYLVGIHEKMP